MKTNKEIFLSLCKQMIDIYEYILMYNHMHRDKIAKNFGITTCNCLVCKQYEIPLGLWIEKCKICPLCNNNKRCLYHYTWKGNEWFIEGEMYPNYELRLQFWKKVETFTILANNEMFWLKNRKQLQKAIYDIDQSFKTK